MVFGTVGVPNVGRVQVEPADLEGREAMVEVRLAEYMTPGGETIRRMEVPYDGWRAVAVAP